MDAGVLFTLEYLIQVHFIIKLSKVDLKLQIELFQKEIVILPVYINIPDFAGFAFTIRIIFIYNTDM